MSILSSAVLIRTISIFNLTIAYYLLTQPSLIASHNMVMIFSRSMHLSEPSSSHGSLTEPNAAGALASLFLGMLGLSDLIAAAMHDEPYHQHWGLQAPLRIAFLFGLTSWIYLTKPDDHWGLRAGTTPSDELKNGLVFGWAFVELLSFFWIFLKIREERQEIARKSHEKEMEARYPHHL